MSPDHPDRVAIACLLVAVAVGGVAVPAVAGASAPPASATTADSATLVYTGDALTVEAEPRQAIRGESTLPAGTELTVRIRSTGDTEPRFLRTTTARVSADGTFTAYFDFAEQAAGDTFSASVRHDGSETDVADGAVDAADGETPGPTQTPVPTTERSTPTAVATGGGYRFVDPVSTIRENETAAISVEVPAGATATVLVGRDTDTNYETGLAVRDDDGDGAVTVAFDTAAASTAGSTMAVTSDGDAVVERFEGRRLQSTLDAADYPLTLYEGVGVDGNATAVGTLVVLESATPSPAATTSPPVSTSPAASTEPRVSTTASAATGTERPGSGTVPDDLVGAALLGAGALLGAVGVLVVAGVLRS